MERRTFIKNMATCTIGLGITPGQVLSYDSYCSRFQKRLRPIGRILELEGYYVWCNSPIVGKDGKIHVFFSRWAAAKKMSGWINGSEIAHAVANRPEGPYTVLDTVLRPRGSDYWDATTCHNPFIREFNNKYYLYYIGNANGKTNTKRIGVATADSLYGPWSRSEAPILLPGIAGAWDDHCTTNPSVLQHRDGKYWLYYKSWNNAEYEQATGSVRGNRKYGLAFADHPEGPFVKNAHNPVIDFSGKGNNAQLEDAFVWQQKSNYYLLARDMGYQDHQRGIIMKSKNGIQWQEPVTAYHPLNKYIQQPDPPRYLTKYGRLERPQLLIKNGRPIYLFGTSQGGKYMTASPFIFKIV